MHGTVPLTGKSGLSNVFAGIFRAVPNSVVYVYPLRSWAALEPIRFAWAWPCAPRR